MKYKIVSMPIAVITRFSIFYSHILNDMTFKIWTHIYPFPTNYETSVDCMPHSSIKKYNKKINLKKTKRQQPTKKDRTNSSIATKISSFYKNGCQNATITWRVKYARGKNLLTSE